MVPEKRPGPLPPDHRNEACPHGLQRSPWIFWIDYQIDLVTPSGIWKQNPGIAA